MSRALADPKSWSDVRDGIRALGATLTRQRGSHQVWRFPDGEIFVIVANHLGACVSPRIVGYYRRVRARRLSRPPPLGRAGPWWPHLAPRLTEMDHEQKQQRQRARWRPQQRRRPFEGRRWQLRQQRRQLPEQHGQAVRQGARQRASSLI